MCRAAGQPCIAVVHWLYHLLLQPDSEVEGFLSGGIPSSYAGIATSSTMAATPPDVVEKILACLGLPAEAPQRTEPTNESAQQQEWLRLRLASSRAMAAYYVLAAAIARQCVEVVTWLLGRLNQLPYGKLIEGCLAGQQCLAWECATASLQVPLLMMAAATGNQRLLEVRDGKLLPVAFHGSAELPFAVYAGSNAESFSPRKCSLCTPPQDVQLSQ